MDALDDQPSDKPQFDLGSVQSLFDRFEATAEGIQQKYVEGAQYAGYLAHVAKTAGPIYTTLVQHVDQYPEVGPIITSGIAYASALENELWRVNEQLSNLSLYSIAGSANTFLGTSGSTGTLSGIIQIGDDVLEPPPFLLANRQLIVAF